MKAGRLSPRRAHGRRDRARRGRDAPHQPVLADLLRARARAGRQGRGALCRRAPTRALEGLPLAVKDEEPIEGLPASQGCVALRNETGTETSAIVERCLRAGGIMHARTTTPEFSCAAITHTRLWGVTRNPWNPEFTPGGSSGRHGRRPGRGRRHARHRIGHRRIDSHPGRLFGRGRLQAALRTQPPGPHLQPGLLQPFRSAGALRRRLRPAAKRHGGPASARHRDGEAEAAPAAGLRLRGRHEDRRLHGPRLYRGLRGCAQEYRRGAGQAARRRRDGRRGRSGLDAERADRGDELSGSPVRPCHRAHAAAPSPRDDALCGLVRGVRHAHHGPRTSSTAWSWRARCTTGWGRCWNATMSCCARPTPWPPCPPTTTRPGTRWRSAAVEVDPVFGWCMTYPFNLMSRCPVLQVPSGPRPSRRAHRCPDRRREFRRRHGVPCRRRHRGGRSLVPDAGAPAGSVSAAPARAADRLDRDIRTRYRRRTRTVGGFACRGRSLSGRRPGSPRRRP